MTTEHTAGLPDASQQAVAATEPPPPAEEPEGSFDHGEGHHGGLGTLVIGAIGVVFGDIGTSPLYALKTVFAINDGAVKPTPGDVYGVISLIFWSVTLIVSFKYVRFVMRADNNGEGGELSLAYLVRRHFAEGTRSYAIAFMLGVLGASLFFGDSVITPAISVLSAVEGLGVAVPSVEHFVLPISATIIAVLFLMQRYGTHVVGRAFGPIMVTWFATLAVLGIRPIMQDPAILKAFLPTYALSFIGEHPFIAFVATGAVVLSVTGAEALYADMGHFGRPAIATGWFAFVFPALTLCYMGQGAEILINPEAAKDPFWLLAPDWARIPLVVLATLATVIASQAVISGAFSVARQAERQGFLPRLTVRHTSEVASGQIYVPAINWLLFGGVMLLLLAFRSSERLATAYGVAVTGSFLITTTLLLMYAKKEWGWSIVQLVGFGAVFYLLEGTFFIANLTKVFHGGWLTLTIAAIAAMTMLTWTRGRHLVTERRRKLEGPMEPFIDWLHTDPVTRVPGTAIFLHPDKSTTPLAFRENANFNHVIHENVWIISTASHDIPHVPASRRVQIDELGDPYDAIAHMTLHFGFQDDQDVPAALRLAQEQGIEIDGDNATYFVSKITLHASDRPGMGKWRKRLFLAMARNAATPTEYFKLPIGQVVVMGAQVRF